MSKVICWLPENFYLEQPAFLIDNGIVPMLDSIYSVNIWKAMGKPTTLRYFTFGSETNQTPYADEIFSAVGLNNIAAKELISGNKGIVVGESSTEDIDRLGYYGAESVTFTAYGKHLFRIYFPDCIAGKPIKQKWLQKLFRAEKFPYGINVRFPKSNQIKTWEELGNRFFVFEYDDYDGSDNVYGKVSGSWFNRFEYCWIILTQVKDFKELIRWAVEHNKTILICAELWQTTDEIYIALREFKKQYEEVINETARSSKG